MKTTLPFLCALLAAGVAQAADLNPRPGLWEMKANMEHNGQIQPKLEIQRFCLSPEAARDYGQFLASAPQAAGCPPRQLSRNGNHITVEGTCSPGGLATISTSQDVEIVSEREMTTKSRQAMTVEKSGARDTRLLEGRMKFITTDCGDISPER